MKNISILLTNKHYHKKIKKEIKMGIIFLLQFKPKLQEQHPFHFLSLYYALIEKGCRDQVTITINSKTPIPGTTKSRRPRGRMPIGEFRCRPTDNLNLFEPQMRVFFRHLPLDNPRRPSPSEIFSFSEFVKSKWSAASARYKELISKGTCSLKERLLSRNTSVKELSKDVECEMSAGIAGVAKMIERLDG